MIRYLKTIQYLALTVLMLALSNYLQAQVQCYQGYQDLDDLTQEELDALAAAGIDIEVLRSSDPNEIIGTSGYLAIIGEDTIHWVSATQSLPYTIYFENDPDFATAAAQRVEVRHQIHALGNLATFGIGGMWVAIISDVGVMIAAVLNAIRCLFVKNL